MKLFIIFLTMVANLSLAQADGFKTLGGKYKVVKDSQIEISNMPPAMSQDTIGVCYSCAASTLLTAQNCQATSNPDCKSLSDKKIFSQMALAAMGRVAEDKVAKTNQSKEKNSEQSGVFGGNLINSLKSVVNDSPFAPTEECFSLDKILSYVGGAKEASALQEQTWKRLQGLYEKSKNVKKDCPTCMTDFTATAKDQIEKDFNIHVSDQVLLQAFAKETYEKFFDSLFDRPECNDIKASVAFESFDSVEIAAYPDPGKTGNYKDSLSKIQGVLKQGRPLGLTNLCLDEKPKAVIAGKCTQSGVKVEDCKCQQAHATVVAGYRKVCDAKGRCKDSIKVINCWGDSWQTKNDDGWVDAQEILDRSFYNERSLVWLQDIK